MAIDREIRNILNDCANNPILKDISESLYDRTSRLWCTVLDKGGEEEIKSISDEISKIIASLKEGGNDLDPLRRELLIQHISRIRENFWGQTINPT